MTLKSDNPGDDVQTAIIQGVDRYWKPQWELVELDEQTGVDTIYKYLRINRIAILGGGNLLGNLSVTATGTSTPLYAYISDGGFERNQTQQAFVSVPAGHTLLAESLDMTTYEAKKTNLYVMARDYGQAEEFGLTDPPFRVQLNWNLFNSDYQPISRTPIPVTQKIDLELRGFTENATDSATSILQGVMIQEKSVPVDIENLVLTPGDGEITADWLAFTPSEKQDQKYFEITCSAVGEKDVVFESLVGDNQKILTGLTNDLEYTIAIKFIGYDNLKSAGVSDAATPVAA
jgi:hypothetical protein